MNDPRKESKEKFSKMLEEKDPELLKALSSGLHQHISKKRFERSIDVTLPPNPLSEVYGGKMDKETAERIKQIKEEINKRIKERYCRPVIANKDGMIVHDGDCGIYSMHGVCTCGLIHDLLPYPGKVEELYPDFWEDRYKSDIAAHKLGDIWPRVKKLLKMAEDPGAQEALHIMEEADAPPKPMTEEEVIEFEQAMLSAGWVIKRVEDEDEE